MTCTVNGCNQQIYWKSKTLCYYHWKIEQGFITDESESVNAVDERIFLKYSKLIPVWVRSINMHWDGVLELNDILQEGYRILLETIPKIDKTKPESSVKSYVKQTVQGLLKNYLKTNKCMISTPTSTESLVQVDVETDTLSCQPDINTEIHKKHHLKRLAHSIRRLNKHLSINERQVLRQHILAENPPTFRELAKMLNINHPQKALRLRLKIIQKLKIVYECMEDTR